MEGVLAPNTSQVSVPHRIQQCSPSSSHGVLITEGWAVYQETWPWPQEHPVQPKPRAQMRTSGPCGSSPPLSRTQKLLEHLLFPKYKRLGGFPQPELYTPLFLFFLTPSKFITLHVTSKTGRHLWRRCACPCSFHVRETQNPLRNHPGEDTMDGPLWAEATTAERFHILRQLIFIIIF